jgi:large subunit ribosomal protein L24e
MRCSFCGTNIVPGTGKIYVKKSGKLFYFCSSKCEKNLLKLDRKPRDQKWTREGRKARESKGG